jgi:hypothetical protein
MKGRILAALLGGLAVAGVIIAGSPAQTPGTETIVAKAPVGGSALKAVPARRGGAQVGDTRLESQKLFQPGTDVRVGTERFVCTVHFGRVMLCTDQILISGRGTIQAQGIIHPGNVPDELAITGGTGDFADVGGTVTRTLPFTTITLNLIYH